jgi:bifunctional non-homologous end joining protein LigD
MPTPELAEYWRKRDFAKTPEPDGAEVGERKGPLTFMVHKHAASRLH